MPVNLAQPATPKPDPTGPSRRCFGFPVATRQADARDSKPEPGWLRGRRTANHT